MHFVDTHIHIDGVEFDSDRSLVVERARKAGVLKMFVPAINMDSLQKVEEMARLFPNFAFPMIGLHPEDVKEDFSEQLDKMERCLPGNFIAIGEVGLDFYWSREFEKQQMIAFERQVEWACEWHLPLMIHCRKAQNEMLGILKGYKNKLCGGVFHCFTGNVNEARQLLEYQNFALGIGGVLTFKNSRLPEVLAEIPLERIVLETDAPYMAPVPMRGKRNESAFITYIIEKMAKCYAVDEDTVAEVTTNTANKIFVLADK